MSLLYGKEETKSQAREMGDEGIFKAKSRNQKKNEAKEGKSGEFRVPGAWSLSLG